MKTETQEKTAEQIEIESLPPVFGTLRGKRESRDHFILVQNGFLYGSNSWIAVRIPRTEPLTAVNDEKAPDPAKLPWDVAGSEPISIEGIVFEAKQCSSCNGKGVVAECPRCDGAGEVECGECGHERECRKCYGTGRITGEGATKCFGCDGLGKVYPETGVAVGSAKMMPKVLMMLHDIGVKTISPISDKICRFRVGDMDGLVAQATR